MQLKDQDICMNYTQPENAHHKIFLCKSLLLI